MTVDAVLFDFFGTLTPGRSVPAQTASRAEQARALGVDPEAYDRTLSETYQDRFRGVTGDVRGSLAWVAARLGVTPDDTRLDDAERIRLATERQFAEPRPGAVPLLRHLRDNGFRVGVVTDCTAELPRCFADLPVAPWVDAVVFSCLTGHVKPEPDNYLRCCAELGVLPERCVYVGDGGSDELGGATRLGMHAIHLDVPSEREAVAYGRHAGWDGDVVTDLADVAAAVRALTDPAAG